MNTFLLRFSFFAILTTTSFSQPQQPFYPNCSSTFSCGHITNITYPFTGGSRPPHCGFKAYFSLTCIDNATTLLTQNSTTYRVLQLDQSQKTILLSRSDLYDATCPSQFHNTTLNATFFNYMNPQNEVLNLFYGCNTTARTTKPTNLFTCSFAGSGFIDSYHLVGPIPRDPILRIISCSVSVSVPVLRAVGDELTNSSLTLADALKEGFLANYSVPHERLCLNCVSLGGICGFDSGSDSFVCVCGDDRPCLFSLTPPRNGGFNATERVEGLFIGGAVLAGIFFGWLIFYCRQKRKQSLLAKTGNFWIKEVPSPPSSKPISTPPSYPSLNSDINKVASCYGVQVFTYTELEEATDNFDPCRELGDGGFGTVYYGILADWREVAVKRLYENNFKRLEQFMNEVEILTDLRHRNLVKLYGCTPKKSRELLLVYEFVPNGTVGDHLHGKRAESRLLSWHIRLKIAIETAEALTYLHEKGIIHRDVKTNNLLLDKDFHVKVADFGLSRLFPKDFSHISTAPQGTPGYVDPEYYRCYQLTEKSDVYSFGVVLVELISSLRAVDTNRNRQDINLSNMAVGKILNRELHELVDGSIGFERDGGVRRAVGSVAEVAFRCLQQEREMRPSMRDVLEVLREIEMEDLSAREVEVVDMLLDDGDDDDDAVLLKGSVEPPSPDS